VTCGTGCASGRGSLTSVAGGTRRVAVWEREIVPERSGSEAHLSPDREANSMGSTTRRPSPGMSPGRRSGARPKPERRPAEALRGLIEQHLEQLQDCAEILGSLTGEHLVAKDPGLFPHGSVGMHFRHILGYYERFLDGGGRIDYDSRRRDATLETDRGALLAGIAAVHRSLQAMAAHPDTSARRVVVRDNGLDLEDRYFPSSLGRELAFLLSHSVHHLAVVAMMLRVLGAEPPASLGVAPSTLANWRKAH
jgi:uncharacterized damage-inducible protein DinB